MVVASAIGFLAGMALFGAIAFIPLLIQLTTGGSATSAGQILTPIATARETLMRRHDGIDDGDFGRPDGG